MNALESFFEKLDDFVGLKGCGGRGDGTAVYGAGTIRIVCSIASPALKFTLESELIFDIEPMLGEV